MISIERLKELIKEEKYIFSTWGGEIKYFKPDEDYLTIGQKYLEQMFENEEDAKEYLKYGNKTRIVKFEAPNWEELQKMVNDTKEWSVSFRIDCSHSQDLIVTVCRTIGTIDEEQPYIIRLRQLYTCEEIDFEYSKEGYNKARDLCLKLFNGEIICLK